MEVWEVIKQNWTDFHESIFWKIGEEKYMLRPELKTIIFP